MGEKRENDEKRGMKHIPKKKKISIREKQKYNAGSFTVQSPKERAKGDKQN